MSYGTRGLANYHPEIFGPVAHWTLGSTLEATFGSRPLSILSGTERYSDLMPGLRGFYFDGASSLWRNALDADLQMVGDMTFLCLLVAQAGTTRCFVACSGNGETSDVNACYIQYLFTGNSVNYLCEFGSGTNQFYFDVNNGIPIQTPCQHGFTRKGGQVTFYLNGLQVGATSVGISSPDGGSNSKLALGADNSAAAPFNFMTAGTMMASPILFNKALTPSQVKTMYNRSLGPALGLL